MSGDLLSNQSFEPMEGNELRTSVAERVKFLRDKFRLLPLQLNRHAQRIAKELRKKWKEENKLYRQNNKRETPKQRLARWKDMSRRYRLYGLMKMSNRWYLTFRKLRSEMALIVAIYQFSEIESIPRGQENWKENKIDEFDSLVLRMRGPRKPRKKNFGMRDLDYDVGDAFLLMLEKLVDWAKKTKEVLDKLTAPRKKMSYKTKVKRFKNTVEAREYLTVLTQSLAPRQKGIRLLEDIDEMDEDEEEWIQVFAE